jgi:hypothetical protein
MVTFFGVLEKNYKTSWLLNYRVLSCLDAPDIRRECQIRGVSFEVLSDGEARILEISVHLKTWKQ